MVAGAFQITFRVKIHANDIFLFFKNYFWYQHIKTIQNIQTILNFNKKKIKFFKNAAATPTTLIFDNSRPNFPSKHNIGLFFHVPIPISKLTGEKKSHLHKQKIWITSNPIWNFKYMTWKIHVSYIYINRLFNFGVPNIIINKTLEIVALTTPTKHY